MATQVVNYSDRLKKYTLQNAASATANGDIIDLETHGPFPVDLTAFCKWSAGCNAGEVTLEEADDPAYTGTWTPVAVFAFKNNAIDFGRYSGSFGALRMRSSQTVTGGTVTAKAYVAVRRW